MHNETKVKIRIKKYGLHSKYKSQIKLSMQRTLQETHKNWICSKSIFLELLTNITGFIYSKQVNSENASKLDWTNLRKLPQILGMNTKLTELVLSFYHFPTKSYTLNKLSNRAYEITLKP